MILVKGIYIFRKEKYELVLSIRNIIQDNMHHLLKNKIIWFVLGGIVLMGTLAVLLLKRDINEERIIEMNEGEIPLINIYPTPQKIEVVGSGFKLEDEVGVVLPEGYEITVFNELKKTLLNAGVRHVKLFKPTDEINTDLTVYVSNNTTENWLSEHLGNMSVEQEVDTLPEEGYILASGLSENQKTIVIAANDWDGAFYGVKSLKAVLNQSEKEHMSQVLIEDYPKMRIRGVIEGFYGIPWSFEERKDQIEFYGNHKMNTYVYAPKDDPYHRDLWRHPYPKEKKEELKELIETAKANHVDFVFTISPGLDICYSNDDELQYLIFKLETLYQLGARHFAVLFDDILQTLNCQSDRDRFSNEPSPAASAQAYVLNAVNEQFINNHDDLERLITVPTEYYQASTSIYRSEFAKLVHPSILVYWTGIGITTSTITNEDASKIADIFDHDLLIWDNYPVSDFAKNRLFLAPLTGRSPELTENGVVGITANPMEHAEASKIPLFTIADFTWNPDDYQPESSWDASLKEFAGEYYEDMKIFAENLLSSELSSDESPSITTLIKQFWDSFNTGTIEEASQELNNAFKQLYLKADILEENFPNQGFLEEVNPWIDKMRFYGKALEKAVQMLVAQLNNNPETAAQLYNELEAILEEEDTTDITIEETRVASRKLDGVNTIRGEAKLIQYTPSFGETTNTNQWGYEITVVDGIVTKVSGNNSRIPENGYVLSVHSAGDGDWLLNHAIVGAKVDIEDNIVTITIEEGIYDIPNLRIYAFNVIEPFIKQAIQVNHSWLGGRDEAGPFTSADSWQTYTIDNIADDDLSTLYWSARGLLNGDYVGIDLGTSQSITKISLYMASTTGEVPRPNDYIKHGVIEISSDGIRWENLGEYEDQAEIILELSEAKKARFVRFRVVEDQTDWAQIREFKIE